MLVSKSTACLTVLHLDALQYYWNEKCTKLTVLFRKCHSSYSHLLTYHTLNLFLCFIIAAKNFIKNIISNLIPPNKSLSSKVYKNALPCSVAALNLFLIANICLWVRKLLPLCQCYQCVILSSDSLISFQSAHSPLSCHVKIIDVGTVNDCLVNPLWQKYLPTHYKLWLWARKLLLF